MKTNIIVTAALAAGTLFTACCNNQNSKAVNSQNSIFPKGELIQNGYFTGDAYLQRLMTDTDAFDCSVSNVTFDAGCRNNWHSHPGGQILMVISGEGYYQEQGKPIQLIRSGDIVEIEPDVVHWHGATPDSPMEHLAIGTRTGMGPVVWGEPVTDEEYNSYK